MNFEKLRTIFVDLTDVGGKEYFVLELDGLISYFVTKSKLFSLSDDWPFLQVIWLVERFLVKLKQRRCIFDIVQFESNASIWSTEPKVGLFRKVLFKHLAKFFHQENKQSAGERIFSFKSPLASDWLVFLNATRPTFVMTGEIAEENQNFAVYMTQRFRIPIAFINIDLEFKGNHLLGFITHGSRDCVDIGQDWNGVLNIEQPEQNTSCYEIAETRDGESLYSAVLQQISTTDQDFAKFCCLTITLQRHLSIEQRIFPDLNQKQNFSKQTDLFYKISLDYFDNFEYDELFCDFFDERLLQIVVKCFSLHLADVEIDKCLENPTKVAMLVEIDFSSIFEQDDFKEVFRFETTENASEKLSNQLFLEILSPVLSISDSTEGPEQSEGNYEVVSMAVKERHHWHALRELPTKEIVSSEFFFSFWIHFSFDMIVFREKGNENYKMAKS